MAERWSYPVPQAMQRHTGCRFAPPPKAPSPPTVPELGVPESNARELSSVVPANAGTHTPQPLDGPAVMGPGPRARALGRDDSK